MNNSQYWPKPPKKVYDVIGETAYSENTISFALKIDNKIVARGTLTKVDDNLYDLGGIFVDPSFRGNSLGNNLVNMVNDKLKELKAEGFCIAVDGSDVLYGKNGWVEEEKVYMKDKVGIKMKYKPEIL